MIENDINFRNLETFVAVARFGSFSRASKTLEITKSSVSKRIAEIEASLSTRLLQRTTRAVSLTESGKRLFELAEPLLLELRDTLVQMRESNEEPAGLLKVTAPVELGDFICQRVARKFCAIYPKLNLNFDLSDHYHDLVATSTDVSIRIGKTPDTSLVISKLAEIKFATVASRDYVEKFKGKLGIADISRHRLLVYDRHVREAAELTLRRGKNISKVRSSQFIAVSHHRSLMQLAESGLGIAFLPIFLYREKIEGGDLIPVLDGWTLEPVFTYAVFPSRKYLSPKVRRFIDFVSSEISNEMSIG